jgi:hypothetical protein
MRSSIVSLAVAVGCFFGGSAAAQDPGMAALEALGGALRGAEAWQAQYRQEYIAAGMSAGERVAGVVVVAWPDRALFRAGDPTTQMMGLDGLVVRLVDLEAPSCDEHILDAEEWARIPLAAVLDPRGAVDRFTVLEHGDRGFVLVPREPGGVDRLEVVLGGGDLPEEVIVVDPQGATNRLRFTDWQKSDGPPDGRWLPDPPPGLTCITDNR